MEFRCRLSTPGGEITEEISRRRQRSAAAPRARGEGALRPVAPAAARGRRVRGSSAHQTPDARARVPGLQPGAGHAAQGRHAARAVARHPATAAPAPAVPRRARRRPREGAGRDARCRTRSPRTATCSRASTRPRCWRARRAATSSGPAALRRVRRRSIGGGASGGRSRR